MIASRLGRWNDAWRRIWFQERTTLPLEVIRMGLGFMFLVTYGSLSPELFALYGDDGWISRAAIEGTIDDPLTQSVFFYFNAPWQWIAMHVVFLGACFALAVGWRTSWVKWVVLIGHLSYISRNSAILYGIDGIASQLLIVLCVMPIGSALSLDRVRAVRRAKRSDLAAVLEPATSAWAFAGIRLIQLQMAVLFFFAGAEKLAGPSWWRGEALWIGLTNVEYANFWLDILAHNFWLANLLAYGTIMLELAYPFLVWQRHTRPTMLAGAVLLHIGIAVMLNLYAFSAIMILGHLAFLRPEWLARWGNKWKARTGAMEMIYDGMCGFCVRSMAAFLAFDGLKQIHIRDYRTDPSPVVPSEKVDRALYVVTDDGRALPGFDAYRYIVARVPGMWWLVPLFYIPLLSRAVGRPIYNWIASHRHVISTCVVGPTVGSACALPTGARNTRDTSDSRINSTRDGSPGA